MLSIIIVNYNSWDFLKVCLKSIHPAMGGYPYEVIVVDNASKEDRASEIQTNFPWITLIMNEKNIGFAAANNIGIKRSRGKYILLLNPDTEAEIASFKEMINFLEMVKDAGIVGPKIYYPTGELQYSCSRFPTLFTEFLENFPFHKLTPTFSSKSYYLYRGWDHASTRTVGWVTGACFMIKRETIEQIGLLDEAYFMYSEELDWCYRAKEFGWKTYYHPKAVIIHYEGGSSLDEDSTARFQKLVYRHYIKSNRIFFRKFYGLNSERLLRFLLWTSYSLRNLKLSSANRKIVASEKSLEKAILLKTVIEDIKKPLDVFF